MVKKTYKCRKPSSYYGHNIWKTQQLFENHLGSLIGANAASSGCLFRCFTFSRRYLQSNPMVSPPVRQSLHGKSHLQCRKLGASPVLQRRWQSRHGNHHTPSGVFWFNAIFSVVSTDTDNKIRFKMFTYNCQEWVLLDLSKQYIISTYFNSFDFYQELQRNSKLHDFVHLHPVSSSFAFWYGIVGRVLMITNWFLCVYIYIYIWIHLCMHKIGNDVQ